MEDNLRSLDKFLESIDEFLTIICNNPIVPNKTNDKIPSSSSKNESLSLISTISEVVYPYSTIENKSIKFSTSSSNTKNNERRIKQYKFKFFKRENIDKKLIRCLKLYLRKNSNRYKSKFIDEFLMNKYTTPCVANDVIHFNSINYKYIKWIFSHIEMRNTLQDFINDELEQFVNTMSANYGVSNREDLICLRAYINDYKYLYQ